MNALNSMVVTKRNHRRYKVKDRTLAIFDVAIPFHIIEISKNGLAFRYIGSEKWFDDPQELDIVCDGLCLKKIKVQTVSDLQVPTDLLHTRRHGVKFCGLSPFQKKQLDRIIQICMQ